jgi:probable rRNA maturation factor
MIDFENQTDFEIELKELEKISNFITNKNFELIITTDKIMKNINFKYRNIDKTTDVLSFPLEFVCENMPIGTIIISIDKVKEKAEELGHREIDELKLLLIHGLLHLIGYDHETDNGEMREKEREIITHFKLPNSLIIRNS